MEYPRHDLVLEGDYSENHINDITSEFISYMKQKTDLDLIPDVITIAEWEGKIKVWKESTLTSPSRFHLSHGKALVLSLGLDVESP